MEITHHADVELLIVVAVNEARYFFCILAESRIRDSQNQSYINLSFMLEASAR